MLERIEDTNIWEGYFRIWTHWLLRTMGPGSVKTMKEALPSQSLRKWTGCGVYIGYYYECLIYISIPDQRKCGWWS